MTIRTMSLTEYKDEDLTSIDYDNDVTFREHPQRAIQETCDLRLDTCDTEYISDN